MSVIVEFDVPARRFLLAETLNATPGMTVDIDRVVAHDSGHVTPYFWITGGDYDAFDEAIRDDPSVENVVRLDEMDDAALYRADWTSHSPVVEVYRGVKGVILEAVGRDGTWELRMRFDTRAELGEFLDGCDDHDLPATVRRIYDPDEPKQGQTGLTNLQHATLVEALDAGYYEVPRRVTHEELADRLGVSQQAVSTRLHRAHANLVQEHLLVGDGEGERAV